MAGPRPRDSQHTKFQQVLASLRPASGPSSMEYQSHLPVNAFLGKVTRSQWWKKRVSRPISFTRYSGYVACSHAASHGEIRYFVPTTRYDLIHHLAHVLTPLDAALHGSEFAKEFAALVERFMGQEAKKNVLVLYKNFGVKSRTWSPEAKARAVQRAAEKGTPFGNQRLEAARAGVLDILRDLTGTEQS